MNETLEEKAYAYLEFHRKITPTFLIFKLKLSDDAANKLCGKIQLRQHLEARKLAKQIEYLIHN